MALLRVVAHAQPDKYLSMAGGVAARPEGRVGEKITFAQQRPGSKHMPFFPAQRSGQGGV
jgi:hypothetical protein